MASHLQQGKQPNKGKGRTNYRAFSLDTLEALVSTIAKTKDIEEGRDPEAVMVDLGSRFSVTQIDGILEIGCLHMHVDLLGNNTEAPYIIAKRTQTWGFIEKGKNRKKTSR